MAPPTAMPAISPGERPRRSCFDDPATRVGEIPDVVDPGLLVVRVPGVEVGAGEAGVEPPDVFGVDVCPTEGDDRPPVVDCAEVVDGAVDVLNEVEVSDKVLVLVVASEVCELESVVVVGPEVSLSDCVVEVEVGGPVFNEVWDGTCCDLVLDVVALD